MKVSSKTKKQLIDEITALQVRVAEFEAMEREAGQTQRDFGERIGRYFPQVNHMKEPVYVIFDKKYEFVNDQFAEMFDVTREEVCDRQFDPMSLVAPESRSLVRDYIRKGTRGEFSAQQYEYTGLTKNGTRIEFETFVLFIPYKWGVAIHGTLRNISLQKRIDEELQRHRSDLQIVLNSIPSSIFYTDREHRFIRANKSFCQSLGFPLEHIIGKTLTELFPNLPAEQLSHFYEVNDQVMSSGMSKRGFIEILPAVRGRRWIQNDRVPYQDDEGKIIGVICIAIDISDLRETEEKLWYLSFHDVLTGLYNRSYFDEEMNRIKNSRRFPVSVVTVRVDDLMDVNNRYGIAEGNELLIKAAKVMNIFRADDVTARIGGDKFAALMPLSDKAIGENAVLRLLETLEAKNKEQDGRPLRLSIGVSTGEKGCSLPDILKQAEASISQETSQSRRAEHK